MKTGYTSAEEAVQLIESGNRVFIHSSAAMPQKLVAAMLQRAGDINNIELVAISTYGDIDWNHPAVLSSFYFNSLFVAENNREWANSEHGGYIPIFLSEIPQLFDQGYLPLDVALLQVSPPDEHGYCTLGTSADVSISAARNAKKIIAQVNPRMPRVLGDGFIHISRFDAMIWEEAALFEVDYSAKADPVSDEIGTQVAALVEDGATLQMGIGGIPDAVLGALSGHKDLGIHTEMFSDGVIPLVEKGIITNARKKVCCGKIVSSFVLGTRKVYDFVDNNPNVNCMDVAFVNDVSSCGAQRYLKAANLSLQSRPLPAKASHALCRI